MSAKNTQRPTNGELEILRVLWSRGPSTVREVHETLAANKSTSCNTTLKLMQIMTEKGMVTRDESRRPQVYCTALPADKMQQRLVRDFLERALGGSAEKLVLHALQSRKVSAKELDNIRKMLDEYESNRNPLEEGRK
ncbi:MAG: BlaI/MecI/CopY family transcriptional regulator [Pseudomonadota bacterium]